METAKEPQNFAVIYTPTMAERMWRKVGFRTHIGDDPADVDALPGWVRTHTRMHFGWADRLRLLLTGRLTIDLTQYAPVKVDWTKNRLDWRISYPGERK